MLSLLQYCCFIVKNEKNDDLLKLQLAVEELTQNKRVLSQ